MRSPGHPVVACLAVLAYLGTGALLTVRAQDVTTLTTLHSFTGGSDSAVPVAGLVQGSDGNFYGTANGGGQSGDFGSVFRITPAGLLTTLHAFAGGTEGAAPVGPLVQGRDGNFYGTTASGGAEGIGTVFRITPTGALTNLYSFTYGSDSPISRPQSGLVLGNDGNFYGTTSNLLAGTVFQITPAGVLTTLHTFSDSDGFAPNGLLLASDGNFYGTAAAGEDNGNGTVFQITPAGVLTVLHRFNFGDGFYAEGSLVQGSDGNFYGATNQGGANALGTVFQVTPAGALTTLHSFNGSDGEYPVAGLVQGSDGNFYGTTEGDGSTGYGTIFQLSPAGVLTNLYSFSGGMDGSLAAGGLVQGGDGSFYGTTAAGGADGMGTVFKLSVITHPAFFTGQAALADGVYYLTLPDGNPFGYYSFLADPAYLYHFDLGYEYVFDANDGKDGVYLYDFASGGFFYTSPTFPFPYLYDFNLQSVVYYFPDPANAGHYTTNPRSFYVFSTGEIISK